CAPERNGQVCRGFSSRSLGPRCPHAGAASDVSDTKLYLASAGRKKHPVYRRPKHYGFRRLLCRATKGEIRGQGLLPGLYTASMLSLIAFPNRCCVHCKCAPGNFNFLAWFADSSGYAPRG